MLYVCVYWNISAFKDRTSAAKKRENKVFCGCRRRILAHRGEFKTPHLSTNAISKSVPLAHYMRRKNRSYEERRKNNARRVNVPHKTNTTTYSQGDLFVDKIHTCILPCGCVPHRCHCLPRTYKGAALRLHPVGRAGCMAVRPVGSMYQYNVARLACMYVVCMLYVCR